MKILLLLCFQMLWLSIINPDPVYSEPLTTHHPERSRRAQPITRIQAAYWGLKSIEQGKVQLSLLKKYGLNTALVKEGEYHLNGDLWRGWGDIAGSHDILLLPVLNFAGPKEIEHLQRGYVPYVDRYGRVFSSTPCPLDADYWNAAIAERFVQLAYLANVTHIAGAIFDTEMYGSDFLLYHDFCFCDSCWQEFTHLERHDAFSLPKEKRFEYLYHYHLLNQYSSFQEKRLQDLLSRIEKQIHSINPDFLFGFLMYKNRWFYHSLIRGLGTRAQPVLVFSESSYIQGYTPYVTEEKREIGESGRYIPGLWLGQFFPEDLSSQCYALATHTDGYWLFTADSLWTNGQNTGDYALHGDREEYWIALKKANEELLRFSRKPDSFRSDLPPVYVSSFYETSQNRLVTQPALEHFLRNIVSARIRNLSESARDVQTTTKITYRGKTLFHGLKEPARSSVIHITHIPLGRYTDPTEYKLFDEHGMVFQEGSLQKDDPSVSITLPPEVSGIMSLLIDSGANGTQVTFSELPFIVEASSTFPLSTINTARTYEFYVKPEQQRLLISAYCSGNEAASVTIRSPDNLVDSYTNVSGFSEIKIPIPSNDVRFPKDTHAEQPNPQLSLQIHSGQVIPLQAGDISQHDDRNFWTIGVASTPYTPFEDIRFYLYNEEYPYIMVRN